MLSLNTYRKNSVSLPDVCRELRGTIKNCTVLLLSTKSFSVAEVDLLPVNGRFNSGDGSLLFVARAFNKDYELRWTATLEDSDAEEHDSKGEAVLLTEKKPDLLKGWDLIQTPFVEKNEVSYIMRGRHGETDASPERSSMCDRTADESKTPKVASGEEPSDEKPQAEIRAFEYIAADDGHGNCPVIAERVCGWKPL